MASPSSADPNIRRHVARILGSHLRASGPHKNLLLMLSSNPATFEDLYEIWRDRGGDACEAENMFTEAKERQNNQNRAAKAIKKLHSHNILEYSTTIEDSRIAMVTVDPGVGVVSVGFEGASVWSWEDWEKTSSFDLPDAFHDLLGDFSLHYACGRVLFLGSNQLISCGVEGFFAIDLAPHALTTVDPGSGNLVIANTSLQSTKTALQIYQVSDGEPVNSFEFRGIARDIAVANDHLLVVQADGTIQTLKLPNGRVVQSIPLRAQRIILSDDGELFAAVSFESGSSQIDVGRVTGDDTLRQMELDQEPTHLKFLPDGNQLVSISRSGKLRFLGAEEPNLDRSAQCEQFPELDSRNPYYGRLFGTPIVPWHSRVAVDPQAQRVVCEHGKYLRIWDFQGVEEYRTQTILPEYFSSLDRFALTAVATEELARLRNR